MNTRDKIKASLKRIQYKEQEIKKLQKDINDIEVELGTLYTKSQLIAEDFNIEEHVLGALESYCLGFKCQDKVTCKTCAECRFENFKEHIRANTIEEFVHMLAIEPCIDARACLAISDVAKRLREKNNE